MVGGALHYCVVSKFFPQEKVLLRLSLDWMWQNAEAALGEPGGIWKRLIFQFLYIKGPIIS